MAATTAPRRSMRIAAKPLVTYTDSTDQDILDILQDHCIEMGYTFSQELLTDYNAYLDGLSPWYRELYDYRLRSLSENTLKKHIIDWVKWSSKRLKPEVLLASVKRNIHKYCDKHHFQYDPRMPLKYLEWYQSPDAAPHITYTIPAMPILPCECGKCDNANVSTRTFTYDASLMRPVSRWFNTLKKSVIL